MVNELHKFENQNLSWQLSSLGFGKKSFDEPRGDHSLLNKIRFLRNNDKNISRHSQRFQRNSNSWQQDLVSCRNFKVQQKVHIFTCMFCMFWTVTFSPVVDMISAGTYPFFSSGIQQFFLPSKGWASCNNFSLSTASHWKDIHFSVKNLLLKLSH